MSATQPSNIQALPTLSDIEAAAAIVYEVLAPTPQYRWPQLCEMLGTEVWVKHENHTPTGAFKLRGGLVYFHHLQQRNPKPNGVISATRGNHGQSVAFAAQRFGMPATIVVPFGNGAEKNAAMRALGAELIEFGEDFQAAFEHAEQLAQARGLHLVPSFHPHLVAGVATGSLELLRAVPDLDVVYVPIGLGSGICAMMAVRDALGLSTEIVGVVSSAAPSYSLSFAARRAISHPVDTVLADGMAVRTPNAQALAQIVAGVSRIVTVTDEEVAAAMRDYFTHTHNVSEGAGAAALAAAKQVREQLRGRRVALVLSGANVDARLFAEVLR